MPSSRQCASHSSGTATRLLSGWELVSALSTHPSSLSVQHAGRQITDGSSSLCAVTTEPVEICLRTITCPCSHSTCLHSSTIGTIIICFHSLILQHIHTRLCTDGQTTTRTFLSSCRCPERPSCIREHPLCRTSPLRSRSTVLSAPTHGTTGRHYPSRPLSHRLRHS